jgi:hypothetical protein
MKLIRVIKICLNEIYNKVHIAKHLSNTFSIQNGLKQGDALLPLPFNFALKCAIRKVQKNLVGLKMNRNHYILACADDVNLQGDSIDTIKNNTGNLIGNSRKFGSDIKAEKSKLRSHYQSAGKNVDIFIANRLTN